MIGTAVDDCHNAVADVFTVFVRSDDRHAVDDFRLFKIRMRMTVDNQIDTRNLLRDFHRRILLFRFRNVSEVTVDDDDIGLFFFTHPFYHLLRRFDFIDKGETLVGACNDECTQRRQSDNRDAKTVVILNNIRFDEIATAAFDIRGQPRKLGDFYLPFELCKRSVEFVVSEHYRVKSHFIKTHDIRFRVEHIRKRRTRVYVSRVKHKHVFVLCAYLLDKRRHGYESADTVFRCQNGSVRVVYVKDDEFMRFAVAPAGRRRCHTAAYKQGRRDRCRADHHSESFFHIASILNL